MRSVATFSSFPCSEQFCQSPHFSHPSGHRSLEKGRRGTGDFNLVSTSSNLKGRRGEGRHCSNGTETGKYHQSRRILSTMTRGEREGGKQTGKREIICRLIGPGASTRVSHVTRSRAGDCSLVTHARADTRAESWPGLPGAKKIGNKVRSRGKLQSFSGRKVPHRIKLELKNKFGFLC